MTIFLRKLNPKKDISNDYLKWMNDFEVNKYTEQKYKKHKIKDIKKFVNEKNKSNNEFLYGIFFKKKHIGNIKLGPINFIHKSAEISYFIGEKELWGKGYATKAIKLIIKIAKRKGQCLGIVLLKKRDFDSTHFKKKVGSLEIFCSLGNRYSENRLIKDLLLKELTVL